MIYQRISGTASEGERILSFLMYGPPAILAASWAFGDLVDMVDPAMATPEASAALGTPSATRPWLETT